ERCREACRERAPRQRRGQARGVGGRGSTECWLHGLPQRPTAVPRGHASTCTARCADGTRRRPTCTIPQDATGGTYAARSRGTMDALQPLLFSLLPRLLRLAYAGPSRVAWPHAVATARSTGLAIR